MIGALHELALLGLLVGAPAPEGASPPPKGDGTGDGTPTDTKGAGGKADKKGKKGRPARGKKGDPKDGATEEDAPPMTSYQVEIEISRRENAIAADRKRGIGLLEEFIAKHQRSRAMPEALYRLSALYWERSQERFLSGMETWASRVEACRDDPESCPDGPPPEPNLDLTDSQTLYVRLITEYPTFRKIDTVRYLYGFSLRDQGKTQEAQDQFWAIIKQHPQSSFVPDSWMAVGDHRFYGGNNYRPALEAYSHVLAYPQSDAYAMALFKAAWCHWKLGEREQAILRFKEVLDQGADPTTDEAGRKRLADLREEALEYLVQVLTEDETQTPKDIYGFLASIGGEKYSRKVLVRLAEAYEAQTRYDKSVPTYRYLLELTPNHADNGRFQEHVFIGVRGTGKPDKALDELAVLHTGYGRSSAWGKAHRKEAIEVDKRGETLLYDFSRSLHENAQAVEEATKVPDKDRYGLVARAYEDYIGRFPANPHAVEVSYLAGDIYLFKLQLDEQAGDAYLRVGESAPVGKLHRDALMAAVTAYEQALQKTPAAPEPAKTAEPVAEPGDTQPETPDPKAKNGKKSKKSKRGKKRKNGKKKPETPPDEADQPAEGDAEGEIPDKAADTPEPPPAPEPPPPSDRQELERKFVRAVELFAALFPKDDEIASVIYKLGEFFYTGEDYDAATQRFGRVVVDYPRSEEAGAAGDRILESLNKAKDYDNIELWAQKLKGAPAFSAKAEQQRLDRIIVESLLKQGETLASRGYYARSASYYLRVAREYPKHEQAPTALNNAGAALERADRAAAATDVYQQLATDYKGTPEAAQATLIVARVNENIARYDEAAARYDDLVKGYPKHKERADALYNAGVLYQAMDKDDEAIGRYRQYVAQYGDRDDVVDVELRIGQVHADAGNHKEAVKAFEKFLKRHGRNERAIEANTRLGMSLLELGKTKRAGKALAAAVKAGRKAEGEMRIFGAQARYLEGELVYRRFDAAKLDPRPSKLGKSLERKAKLLGQAKDIFIDVVSFRSPEWATSALFKVGESYEGFAKGLREYPIPENLSEEEQDAYMEQLDTFALAFEEQAIEAYRSGYAKAMELKIYNGHTRKIREALGRLSSQEFPPIAEAGTELVVAEGGATGGRPVRRLSR